MAAVVSVTFSFPTRVWKTPNIVEVLLHLWFRAGTLEIGAHQWRSPVAFAPDQVDDMQHQLLVVRLAITFLRGSRVGDVLLEVEALGREGGVPLGVSFFAGEEC